MAFLADSLNSMAWIVRSHDLSGVGQAQHHWDLSREEKDWGPPKITFYFCIGENMHLGAAWFA
jgi:hypothetical protein